jgi:hypothetical protein
MNDKIDIKMKGTITIFNNKTNTVDGVFHNMTTDIFFEALANFFTGSGGEGIRYFGISDTLGVIASTRTSLNNEVLRKIINSKTTDGSDMIFTIIISETDAVGDWKEVGLFEDSTSGDMFTIAEIDYTHVSGEALTITYKLEKA